MKQTIKTLSIIAVMIGSLNVFALDNKQQGGTVVGGIIGGVVGNQIGGGTGRVIATGLGIILGAAVGNSIGASLDRMDQQALRDAQHEALVYAPVGQPVEWDGAEYGSRTGSRGRFVTTRRGYHRQYVNTNCSSYRSEIYTRSRSEVRSGTTCQRSDGSWYEVRNSEVRFY